MAKVETLLAERLKKKENSVKIEEMARRSSKGELTSFSGVFHLAELSPLEKQNLKEILDKYKVHSYKEDDLERLIAISSEVKAINNQAVLLHGERIKKAQKILTGYQEGAFTAWLIALYGNRQTPYNFLQYYEFCSKIPSNLKQQFEMMPRQAIYTLAARDAPIDLKCQLIQELSGKTKHEILTAIRDLFPLKESDRRKQKISVQITNDLQKILATFELRKFKLNQEEKKHLLKLAQDLMKEIKQK